MYYNNYVLLIHFFPSTFHAAFLSGSIRDNGYWSSLIVVTLNFWRDHFFVVLQQLFHRMRRSLTPFSCPWGMLFVKWKYGCDKAVQLQLIFSYKLCVLHNMQKEIYKFTLSRFYFENAHVHFKFWKRSAM